MEEEEEERARPGGSKETAGWLLGLPLFEGFCCRDDRRELQQLLAEARRNSADGRKNYRCDEPVCRLESRVAMSEGT